MPISTAARNKRIMKKFYDVGAIGPQKAISAEEAGLHDNIIMDRFIKLGFLAREGEKLYIPVEFTETRRWKLMFGNKDSGE